jgi:hypothetical protein
VARIGVVIVGLDVADASVIVLELPLNDKIGVVVARKIEVIIAGVLVVELDREERRRRDRKRNARSDRAA